jgi:hypothetical protein
MITKLDAAERQLNTAIRLFFENRDRLSSYTLAVASREVTDDLIENKSDEVFQAELTRLGDPERVRLSFREQYKDLIKPKHYKDALVLSRKLQNFLKHAGKDPDATIEEPTQKELALNIMFAAWNFSLLAGRLNREIGIFIGWLGAAEPQFVRETPNPFLSVIANIRNKMPDDPYSDLVFELISRVLSHTP